MFVERTWIWTDDFYLEEVLPIQANPGTYTVRYEVLDPGYATVKVRNWQIIDGPAQAVSSGVDTATITISRQ